MQNFDTCNKNKFQWSFQWKSKKKQRFIRERTIEPNCRNPKYSLASSVGRALDSLYQGLGFEPKLGGDFLKLNENIKVNPEKKRWQDCNAKSWDWQLKSQFYWLLSWIGKKQAGLLMREQQSETIATKNTARLDQSVEHGALHPTVVGSSPTLGEDFFKAQWEYKS